MYLENVCTNSSMDEGLLQGLTWLVALGNVAAGAMGLAYFHNLDSKTPPDRRAAEAAVVQVVLGGSLVILASVATYRALRRHGGGFMPLAVM